MKKIGSIFVPTPNAGRLRGLIDVAHLMWSDASPFVRVRLASAAMLVTLSAVLTAAGPIALKLAVDGLTDHRMALPMSLPVLLGLYVATQWIARVAAQAQWFTHGSALRRMMRTLSERLFAHLMQLPLRFHADRQTGAISQTLENGLQGYQIVVNHTLASLIPVSVELITIIIVIAQLHHFLLLGFFGGALICYTFFFAYATSTIVDQAKVASAAHVKASAAMVDGILNYETVKYFTAESIVQQKVNRELERTESAWIRLFRRYSINGAVMATLFVLLLAASILYAAREVQSGRMTTGDFVLINTYLLQVIRPIETLSNALREVSQGIALLEKVVTLFRETPEPQYIESAEIGPGRLEFDNVSLSYRPGQSVLKSVSFRVPAGKTLAIVGASGSGKSTLVRLLTRLYEPSGGQIKLDGQPISALALTRLRQSIAVVPQDTVLFNDTISYNIGFGKLGSTRKEIEDAARLAHLHDFIMGLPDQYDTLVGERGVKLSGGEKQRISIARAAIKRPRIYVFDEATSSLDSTTEREILRELSEISRHCTTLVIAHRLSTVVHADDIVVLDGGTIIERGTHSNLLRQNGRYAALWASQHQDIVAA